MDSSCHQVIETDGVVIIVDGEVPRWASEELRHLGGVDVVVLESRTLATALKSVAEKSTVSSRGRTHLLFPGNGGAKVRRLLNLNGIPAWSVHAKRFWHPGSNPTFEVGQVHTGQFLHLGVDHVIVFDDVISTGGTAALVYERNSWKFPGAQWCVGALISRGRLKRLRQGYERVFSAVRVQHPTDLARQVPINTLSTLLENQDIAKSYARRNFFAKETERFIELLNELRHYNERDC